MPLDIRPDHLKIVEEILEKHVPDREVWAFGSRVNGTAKETSDLDLAVIGENPLEFQTLGALRDAFSESNIPYKVDVVDWAKIGRTFREIIQKAKVIIQKGLRNDIDMIGDNKGIQDKYIEGEEWIECKLSEVCSSIDYGLTASAIDTPVGPHFLRITDIVGGAIDWKSVPYVKITESMFRKFQLNSKDIVIARTGASTGSSMYINNPPPAVFASYLVRLKIKTEFDSRFIAYYLKSSKFWSFIHGVLGDKSAQPNASARTLTQAPLKAPKNKNSQRTIAHILGTLDDKIELNRRMNETLEAMAQAIFKSWFVDFDPVWAKMEGRPTGLPKEIEDLFPDSFENSELGEIPRGWKVATIGEIVNIAGGSTPSTKESTYWENGRHYWATPKDLSSLSTPVLLGTERKITDAGLAQIGSGKLPAGTVLLSSRAPIGYLAISEVPVSINQGFIAMLPREEVSNLFILYWAACAHEEIVSRANGSTFLEISKANFRQILVIRPTKSVMELFESNVRPLYLQIVRNERETMILATLRSSLLPKLLSGEIRVKDAEKTLINYWL